MGFHPDLTLEAKPTASALIERFQTLDQTTQDEVGGAYEDIMALGEGAQDNPQEDDPEDDFLQKPYVKKPLKRLQGSDLAKMLLRQSDIHTGITRDELILPVQDMATSSEGHDDKKFLQKMFFQKT